MNKNSISLLLQKDTNRQAILNLQLRDLIQLSIADLVITLQHNSSKIFNLHLASAA